MDTDSIRDAIRERLDDLTKPKGSLGKLEDFAEKLALVQGLVPPRVRRKAVFVLAGDHGVVDQGVSLYPRAVTAQMFQTIMAGGAGINVLSRACGFDVYAVDAGVDADLPTWPEHGSAGTPGCFSMKAVRGTRDFSAESAFTDAEFEECMQNGMRLSRFAVDEGYDIVALGDMGIGNTTSAAAILVAYGFDPDMIIDRGTGIDDAMLERKRRVILDAVRARGPFETPESVAIALGGPEIVTAAGVMLGLKGTGVACVLDGFPITAGAAIAWKIDPSVIGYLFAGHQSRVKGHRPVLDAMGLEPVVDLGMRLGEGTGAVIGGFVVELGAKVAGQMARFSELAVSRANADEKDF
ncbi:MAG TPA: nicotinate-nucleotide--dimethylbenzimidazole phosphoribosyltransferase [bacterium]|nr:nicotinate-nucleotide--dimethylbenzimidazole phosphoribosyltransferase [bacterium]